VARGARPCFETSAAAGNLKGSLPRTTTRWT
jgi:hypothetical protein